MIQISSLSLVLSALPAFVLGIATIAQGPRRTDPDGTVDREARVEVVESAIREMNDSYVFPEVATKIETMLRERLAGGDYETITSSNAFAERLTEHLQAVSRDKHVRVRYRAEAIPERRGGGGGEPSQEQLERMRSFGASRNFGFERVERLSGNVGYLDLRMFDSPRFAGETAAAAMNFLANTDALIVDLRKNGGGTPTMIQLLCTYLFDAEPVHLNDLYFRPDDRTEQYWTLPYVPGKRYIGKDVYVLTSHYTFSGAEEFTYNLKNLKRATIVGETTGGGANPGGMARLSAHFEMFVPSGRAINPITKTNWEGTGVEPDVEIEEEKALEKAHTMALEKLLESTADPRRRDALQEALDSVMGVASTAASSK